MVTGVIASFQSSECMLLAGLRPPPGAWILPGQNRPASSKPNGPDSPDKPDGKESEDGKDKGEQAQPPATSETSENPAETNKQQLFSPLPSARVRATNSSATSNGLPPVNLPRWFLDEHVRISNSDDASEHQLWNSLWRYFQPNRSASSPGQELSGIWASAVPDDARATSPEQALGRELISTISAELNATPPPIRATKEPKRRPISLLYVHNYKGGRVANDIVGHVATELAADVIHLDATRLANIVGTYLGSTLYFGRAQMSMLGYFAAEANGRSFTTPSMMEFEDDLPAKGVRIVKLLSQVRDDRATWDDLKSSHALKEIVNSAGTKRKLNGHPDKPERLILHVHNYVELMMTAEGASILDRLRTIVDRLWQEGSNTIIVGSVSNDKNASKQWHNKVKELSNSDCYPIIFSPSNDELPELELWEQQDNVLDNLSNINWMLECLRDEQTRISLPLNRSESNPNEAVNELVTYLSSGIYSNHWVYRICTQAIGLERQTGTLDASTLASALKQMRMVDEARSEIVGKSADSSTLPSLPSSSPIQELMALGNTNTPEATSDRRKGPPGDLDEEEKKLLPGIVNVDEIHTTFDEVIVPPETRESLMALTTLSIQHPKAFSYGVLARERIHGCLLYGPPGTGKTLMAKAVAKSSGANMLEISAASINDMWVGNSEKNVRAVFSLARKLSPVVVFLDEADSLLGSRARQPNRGGYRETINQFLREWDGLTNALNTQQIFVLVSTNSPQDLDEAVLRRLPRRILLDLPLKDSRLAILQSLLRDELLDPAVSLEQLASDTELYSGSDLKNLAVAAAMEAAKEELAAKKTDVAYMFPAKRILTKAHFEKATKDISASISEDMQSLKALRKFDEQYGDARRKKKRSNMGFEVVPQVAKSEDARIRK
ncbi:ATPase [Diaporthe amygdali]|uniref:ATPase n=1 Tax=Phomopsis amygdali TaxID=1214568 RepID=UPI0022FE9F2D|nr:ATPase [Diaporthe amygdali]KAJ0125511.1 ATPase [Diaporthe amygdali]